MHDKKKIILLLFLLLIPLGMAKTVTYTPTTQEVCSPQVVIDKICSFQCLDSIYNTTIRDVQCLKGYANVCRNNSVTKNICQKQIYSGVMFVNESGKWVNYTDAKSLKDKNFYIKYLEKDKNYIIDIIDFNATSITLNVSVDDSLKNKDINLKLWKVNDTKKATELTGDYKKDYKIIKEDKLKFSSKDDKQTKTYKFGGGIILEFGGNSTTIILQDNITENLDDARVDEENPQYNFGLNINLNAYRNVSKDSMRSYIKFNISSLGWGKQIISSTLNVYSIYDVTMPNYTMVYPHHMYRSNWTQGTMSGPEEDSGGQTYAQNITWENQPCGVNFDVAGNCNLTSTDAVNLTSAGFYSFNVTDSVIADYNINLNNVSLVLKTNESTDIGESATFYSKEYTTNISRRPFLNITYSTLYSNITDCTVLNQDNVTYFLKANIVNSTTSYCMNISANNVVLDCEGHKVDGNDIADYGLIISRPTETFTNISIKNCTFTDWDTYGSYTALSTGNTFTDVTVNSSTINLGINSSINNKYVRAVAQESSNYDLNFIITNATQCKLEANITATGGLPIVFYNNTTTLTAGNYSEIILCGSNASSIDGVTITGLDNNIGLLAYYSNNSNFTNINFDSLYTPVYDIGGINNRLENASAVTAVFNGVLLIDTQNYYIYNNNITSDWFTIELFLTNNTKIYKNNINPNDLTGDTSIFSYYSNFTNITENSIWGGYYNYYGESCYNDTVRKNVMNSSLTSIVLLNSFYTTITENNVTSDYTVFTENITSNNISSNMFDNIMVIGLSIDGISENNYIYNNYFNCTNYYGCSLMAIYSTQLNYYNTTADTTNFGIDQRRRIGGNYYSDISTPCTDTNKDGFCDSPYDLSSITPETCIAGSNCTNNTEYLVYSDEWHIPTNSNIKNSTAIYAPNRKYQFNITWSDVGSDFKNASIEINHTGTATNYTIATANKVQNVSGEWFFNWTDQTVGLIQYRWFGYDTDNVVATTLQNFTMAKNTSANITNLLNTLHSNATIKNTTQINITNVLTGIDTPTTFTVNTTINSTLVNSTNSPSYSLYTINSSVDRTYMINYSYGGTENYTGLYKLLYFDQIVSPLTPSIVTPTNSSYLVGSDLWFNVTSARTSWWCGYSMAGSANVSLGSNITSANTSLAGLGSASYNITLYCNDSADNQASDIEYFRLDTPAIESLGGGALPLSIKEIVYMGGEPLTFTPPYWAGQYIPRNTSKAFYIKFCNYNNETARVSLDSFSSTSEDESYSWVNFWGAEYDYFEIEPRVNYSGGQTLPSCIDRNFTVVVPLNTTFNSYDFELRFNSTAGNNVIPFKFNVEEVNIIQLGSILSALKVIPFWGFLAITFIIVPLIYYLVVTLRYFNTKKKPNYTNYIQQQQKRDIRRIRKLYRG